MHYRVYRRRLQLDAQKDRVSGAITTLIIALVDVRRGAAEDSWPEEEDLPVGED